MKKGMKKVDIKNKEKEGGTREERRSW